MNEYTLITGATSGIGYELVKLFAKAKDNLILVARNEEKLNEIKNDLVEKYNIDVVVIPMDLSVIENSKKLYDKLDKIIHAPVPVKKEKGITVKSKEEPAKPISVSGDIGDSIRERAKKELEEYKK